MQPHTPTAHRAARRPQTGRCSLHHPLALAIACLASCQARSDAVPGSELAATQTDAPTTSTERVVEALNYAPDDSPTGRAIADAQARVRKDPDDAAAYTGLATVLLRRERETGQHGLLSHAEEVIAIALELDPANADAGILHTMLLQEDHRFHDAAEAARRLIATSPQLSTPHILLGDALLELGRYDDATDAYQEAMNLRPDLRTYNRAAHMRWLRGDVAGARELLELAVDAGSVRDPESIAWCFVDLGHTYLHSGEARIAESAARRALQLVPDYLPALVLRGRARAQTGDTSAAIRDLQAAILRHPTSEELLLLVELLDAAGRPNESAAYLAKAEHLAHHEPRPLAHYHGRHGRHPERAVALAEAELKARANLAAHDTLALALLRAGRVAEAQQAMKQALRTNIPVAEYALHDGLIKAAAKDHAGAKAALQRAISLNARADPLLVAELRAAVVQGG